MVAVELLRRSGLGEALVEAARDTAESMELAHDGDGGLQTALHGAWRVYDKLRDLFTPLPPPVCGDRVCVSKHHDLWLECENRVDHAGRHKSGALEWEKA